MGFNTDRTWIYQTISLTCTLQFVHKNWAAELGTWGIILFFNNKKWFSIFVKLIWLGVGFLNRTDAEIGY